jgi:hypothetical protein
MKLIKEQQAFQQRKVVLLNMLSIINVVLIC